MIEFYKIYSQGPDHPDYRVSINPCYSVNIFKTVKPSQSLVYKWSGHIPNDYDPSEIWMRSDRNLSPHCIRGFLPSSSPLHMSEFWKVAFHGITKDRNVKVSTSSETITNASKEGIWPKHGSSDGSTLDSSPRGPRFESRWILWDRF